MGTPTGIQGNVGGASSAFGLICNGGTPGYISNTPFTFSPQAHGNSPLCNRGTSNTAIGVTSSLSDVYVLSNTKFGQGDPAYLRLVEVVLDLGMEVMEAKQCNRTLNLSVTEPEAEVYKLGLESLLVTVKAETALSLLNTKER